MSRLLKEFKFHGQSDKGVSGFSPAYGWEVINHIDYKTPSSNSWIGSASEVISSEEGNLITHTLTDSVSDMVNFGIVNGIGLVIEKAASGAPQRLNIDILLTDLFSTITANSNIWVVYQFAQINGVELQITGPDAIGGHLFLDGPGFQFLFPGFIGWTGVAPAIGSRFHVADAAAGFAVNPMNVDSDPPLAGSLDGGNGAWRARKSDTASGNVPLVDYADPGEFPDQYGVGGDPTGRCSIRANDAGGYVGLDPITAFFRFAFDKGFVGANLDCVLTDLWMLERPVPA